MLSLAAQRARARAIMHREGAAPAAHAYWGRAVGFLKTLQCEETGDAQLTEGRPGW